MDGLRSLHLLADGMLIAEGCRIRVRGRTVMSLRPDAWEIDIYFLSEEDFYVLHKSEKIVVTGEDDSQLAEGKIEDIYIHREDDREITTIMIVEGMDFWNSTVSITLAGGNSIQESIQTLARVCSSPVQIATIQAKDTRIFRGQTFHGKTAGYISTLAKSLDARAYYVRGALYVVARNVATDTIRLGEDDVAYGISMLDGARIVRLVKMRGFPVGAWILLPEESKRYRLLGQSIDADSSKGAWRTELILINEDQAGTENDWGGG